MAYDLSGICNAQAADSGGSLERLPHTARTVRYNPVKGRSLPWDAAVRLADGDAYRARKPFATYRFGNGQRTRIFTEDT